MKGALIVRSGAFCFWCVRTLSECVAWLILW